MRKHKKRKINILYNIKQYITSNIKQYIIIATVFLVGIAIGVLALNHLQKGIENNSNNEIITNFISCLKDNNYEIEYSLLFKNIIIKHILYTLLLWFLGCSVIGIPIVYILIAYKGFSLGYTISYIVFLLGIKKGLLFLFLTLFLQNIIIIPTIISIAVSGMNLYSSIIKNKRIENIKISILRHTFFCFIMLIMLIIASFIEIYISGFLTNTFVKYI